MEPRELLKEIVDAMRECGEIILHADRGKNHIDEKAGHANFVTVYDKKIQQVLKERFSERRRIPMLPSPVGMPLSWIPLTGPRILSRITT